MRCSGIRQAGGIAECGSVGSPSSRARSVMRSAKTASLPAMTLGDRDAGVVGRLHDDTLDEVFQRDLRFELGIHRRAA